MNSFLNNLVEVSGNENATSVDGGLVSDIKGFISTGSYTLNALLSGSLYGGIPNNKITALAGEQATGKTFFCFNILKTYQENFKEIKMSGNKHQLQSKVFLHDYFTLITSMIMVVIIL